MLKCQHHAKINLFCVYEHCTAKQSAGCQVCIKQYHSHVGNSQIIKIQEIQMLLDKFSVQNIIKPKCRTFQQFIFSFFSTIKNQIIQTIDHTCKGIVNRIGYPYLSSLGHLSSYKRIKSKQYNKISSKQLKKFYTDVKNLSYMEISNKEKKLYAEEVENNYNLIEKLNDIMKTYEQTIKSMCKNFKHDSSVFNKIEQLKKYFNSHFLTLQKNQINQQNQQFNQLFTQLNGLNTSQVNKNKPLNKQKKHINGINNQLRLNDSIKIKDKRQDLLIKTSKNQQYLLQKQKSTKQINFKLQIIQQNYKNQHKRGNKFTHLRSYSTQADSKNFNFINNDEIQINVNFVQNGQTYDSKQREIMQRKQKLIKMMNFKQKNTPKILQSKNTETQPDSPSKIVAPPLLTFQKNDIVKQANKHSIKRQFDKYKNQQESNMTSVASHRHSLSISKEMSDSKFLKIPNLNKNIALSNERNLSDNRRLKSSNSLRSFKQQASQIKQDQDNSNSKYKYAMLRLPSTESNQQSNQAFSNLQSIKKTSMRTIQTKNLQKTNIQANMTVSSPISYDSTKFDTENQNSDSEASKSVCLYLKALKCKHNDAIQYLKAALKYAPLNYSAAEYLSFLYIQQNKAKQCLDLCNQYLNLLSNSKNIHQKQRFLVNKAASLNILGRYSEVITLLEPQALKFQNAKIYKNIADSYLSLGVNQKCQYNYQKAVKLDPKFDQAMYNLSVCLFLQGNYCNAKIWIKKALQINPSMNQYIILFQQLNKKLQKVKQQQLMTQTNSPNQIKTTKQKSIIV